MTEAIAAAAAVQKAWNEQITVFLILLFTLSI